MGEKYQENLEQLEAISEKLKEISVLLTNLSKTSQLGQIANLVSIIEPLSRGLIGLRSINSEVDKMWNKLLGKDEQFRQYGKYVGAGLDDGIEDKLRDIKKSMSKLTDAVLHHRISGQGFI